MGAPNASIRVIIGMSIIKEGFDCSYANLTIDRKSFVPEDTITVTVDVKNTGAMAGKEMNMNLNGLKINISGILNPDKFSGVDTDERAGLKQINVEIIPDTDADEATLGKWLATIENRCPVKDNLSNPTPVHISIK